MWVCFMCFDNPSTQENKTKTWDCVRVVLISLAIYFS